MLFYLFMLLSLHAATAQSQDFVCGYGLAEDEVTAASQEEIASYRSSSSTDPIYVLPLFGKFKATSDPVNLNKLKDRDGNFNESVTNLLDPTHKGSLAHFFSEMSYGALSLAIPEKDRTVAEMWLESKERSRDPYFGKAPGVKATKADCKDNLSGWVNALKNFAREVIAAADTSIDFDKYDSDKDGRLTLVVAVFNPVEFSQLCGPNGTVFSILYTTNDHINGDTSKANTWLYARVITGDHRDSFPYLVGLMAHEYGHVIGLPELYDRTNIRESSTDYENHSAGIGYYGVMGKGNNGYATKKAGVVDGPAPLSEWSRIELGWIKDSSTSTDDRLDTVTGDLDLSIHDINSDNGKVYKIPVLSKTSEYFLLSNRQNTYDETESSVGSYYDEYAPTSGLLIYHVDDTVTGNDRNINEEHKGVDVECADGLRRDQATSTADPVNFIDDAEAGGDDLDYWTGESDRAGKDYLKSRRGNIGDAADVWITGEFTPYTNPSTDSYYDKGTAKYTDDEQTKFTGIAMRGITQNKDGSVSVKIRFIPSAPVVDKTSLRQGTGEKWNEVSLSWPQPTNASAIDQYQYTTDERIDENTTWHDFSPSPTGTSPVKGTIALSATDTKVDYTFHVRAVNEQTDPDPDEVSAPSAGVSFTLDRPGQIALKLSEAPSRDLNNLRVSDVLMATATDPNMSADAWEGGRVSWQWERGTVSGDGWTGSSIADATNADYMLTAAEVGQQVRATVRYNDGVGRAADTAASEPTAVVVGGLVLSGPAKQTVAEVVLPETAPRVVATYETTADGATVTWSLAGPDKNAFTVRDGVLAFASGPNYEHPTASEGSNTYHVTVVATAGAQTATEDVEVEVKNADDPGMVFLPTLQPELGHSIRALLWDEDGGLRQVQFWWFLSGGDGTIDAEEAAGDGIEVSEEEGTDGPSTTLTLSPTNYGLVGRRLQVRAYYEDSHGQGKQAVSAYTEPVIGPPNRPPAFINPDLNPSFAENGSGSVVSYTAKDPDDDTLKWSLRGTDASAFRLEGTGSTRDLHFNSPPNFEVQSRYVVEVVVSDEEESATAPATVSITNVDEAGHISLSPDPPQAGESITATLSDPDGAISGVSWSWTYFSTSGTAEATETASASAGAASLTKTIPIARTRSGYRIQVYASYTDRHGSGKKAQSARSSPITAPRPTDTSGRVSLSTTTPQAGQSITATLSDPDTPITVQRWTWFSANASAADDASESVEDADVEGASGSLSRSLTISNALVGKKLKARVSYTDSFGSQTAESAYTSPVAAAPDQPGSISLSPDPPQAGESVTATLSDPDGSISGVLWSWTYFSASGTAEASASEEAATSSLTKTIPISRTKAGYRIQVSASYTDGHGSGKRAQSARSSPITAPRPTDTSGRVSLSPTAPQAGQSITATLSDPDTPITIQRWTWLSANASAADDASESVEAADAEGANGSLSRTLTISNALVGKKLKARVSYTDSFGSQTAESAYTSPVAAAPDQPGSISLSPDPPQAGESMTATLSDPDGSISGVLWSWTYFSASGTAEATETASASAGAASLTKTIPIARTRSGYRIQVYASYTDRHGSGKKAQSARSSPITAPRPTDTSGRVSLSTTTPQAGQSITATLSDPDTPITVQRWTWFSANASAADDASESVEDADVEGASGSLSRSLTISNALVGKKLKARVSYTDSFGSQTAESAYTSPVAAASDQPGSISLSTTKPQVGQPITATLSDPDGRVSNLRWSWLYFSASGASEGSEEVSGTGLSSTFTPSSVLAGIRLRARVLYDDGHGTGKSAESDKTDPVTRSSSKPVAASLTTPPDSELAFRVAPNPFNPTTSLQLQVPASAPVWLTIYNITGQVVYTLLEGRMLEAGYHTFHWDGRDQQGFPLTSGVYVYQVRTNNQRQTGKMALIR